MRCSQASPPGQRCENRHIGERDGFGRDIGQEQPGRDGVGERIGMQRGLRVGRTVMGMRRMLWIHTTGSASRLPT